MDVATWLRGLGLERYERAFREADVGVDVLPDLTDADLRELGVSLGDRKRLLKAALALPERGSGPASPGAAAEAERRQLTVMFVDLVGSTALSTRLDPEDLRELVGAYHRRVAAAVEREGGFVAKYLGDGVLAYFGYPRAHEDDAERAVRAGLGLVTAVGDLAAPDGAGLRVRVGIATGLVVVGDLLGSGASREEAVVGETPNLAARLQALAEPGGVVIAEGTRRLVGGLFECLVLGEVEAKGFAAPVPAYRVLGVGAAESRFEAFHAAALAPLVGREEEIDLLLRRWRQARTGEGRVVLLAGEPGVGKSRLLAAVQERLWGEPHVRLRHFCSPHGQDSALRPVITQLERAAGFARDDPPEVRLGKLEALLAPTSPPAEDVALLAELLSVPVGDRYASPSLVPERKRELTFAALLRRLERLSARGPVLMVFEDVHWIDPSSRELLDLAVERAARLPVLLLVTFRPEFEPPWIGQPHVAVLALSRLGPREAAALARRVAGGAPLADDLVAEIVERTDGVPLFVEELTKAMLEAGATNVAGTVAATPPAAPAVPATLHASLVARLDRLGPGAREVAQVGAAVGREFSHELLAAVAGRDEAGLAAALDRLAGAGLVTRRGAPPTASYVFKHILVQDAAYGMLLRDRRRRLHGRIARALEERSPELAETAPELIAHHLTEAGEAGRAVGYWLKAGRRSAERSAEREAARQLRRGLAALATLPPSGDRDRLELEFQLALGPRLVSTSGYTSPDAAAAYERARALCESLDDVGRLIPALHGLYAQHEMRGECQAALDLAERVRAAAERGGDPVERLLGHRNLGTALMQLGRLREARPELEAAVALHDPLRDRSLAAPYIIDPHATGLSYLALLLWMLGYPDQARGAAREAIRYAAELEHASTTNDVRFHAGAQLAALLGDCRATEAHAHALIAVAGEYRLQAWWGFGAVLRGWALARDGRLQEGLALARRGETYNDALGNMWHGPRFLVLLAEVHARLGDPTEALSLIARAQAQVKRTGEDLWQADVHRAEGELRQLAGAPGPEVEACFFAALAVARRQEAKSFELRAAAGLARLWRDRERRAEARELLAPVYGWFTEGLDTADLREAKMLLDELR